MTKAFVFEDGKFEYREPFEKELVKIKARWVRTFLEYQDHVGRHRRRLLANAPNLVTGTTTYMGCEKCGKPMP